MADEGMAGRGEGRTMELDNRGLQPPQPALRILEALERMGPGDVLVVMNPRRPAFLLPELVERGFTCEMEDQSDGTCRLVIRRAEGTPAPGGGAGVRRAAAQDFPCAGEGRSPCS